MLAQRLPLLSAFVVGCLSGAVIIGFCLHDAKQPEAVSQHGRSSKTTEVVESSTRASRREHPSAEHGARDTSAVPADSAAVSGSVEHKVAPDAPSKDEKEPSEGAAPEGGSSVADVLARLEAEYRRHVSSRAPVEVAAAVKDGSRASAEPQDSTSPAESAAAPAASQPAMVAEAAAPLAPAAEAPPKAAAEPELRLAVAPDSETLRGAAAGESAPQDSSRTQIIYVGDDQHESAWRESLRQQAETYQRLQQLTAVQEAVTYQQLAMLSYLQLLALSPYAASAPTHQHQPRARGRSGPFFQSSFASTGGPSWTMSFGPITLVR